MASKKRNTRNFTKRGSLYLCKGKIKFRESGEISKSGSRISTGITVASGLEHEECKSGYVSVMIETVSSKGSIPNLKRVPTSSKSVSLFMAGGRNFDEMVAKANAAIAKKHGL